MNETEATPKNIVLIGFMGCGKSTVGRELHQRLGYRLMDIDQIIEETMGKRITEIFREEGEQKVYLTENVYPKLDELNDSLIILTADVTGLAPGTHQIPVKVDLPQEYTLIKTVPETIDITIEP